MYIITYIPIISIQSVKPPMTKRLVSRFVMGGVAKNTAGKRIFCVKIHGIYNVTHSKHYADDYGLLRKIKLQHFEILTM